MSQVDELFSIDESSASQLTPSSRIEEALRSAAQALLDAYVRAQGDVLSQMLRRSVETRDWLNTVEPRWGQGGRKNSTFMCKNCYAQRFSTFLYGLVNNFVQNCPRRYEACGGGDDDHRQAGRKIV